MIHCYCGTMLIWRWYKWLQILGHRTKGKLEEHSGLIHICRAKGMGHISHWGHAPTDSVEEDSQYIKVRGNGWMTGSYCWDWNCSSEGLASTNKSITFRPLNLFCHSVRLWLICLLNSIYLAHVSFCVLLYQKATVFTMFMVKHLFICTMSTH